MKSASRYPPPIFRVSVLTPSLGYGRFIGDALASVALQQGDIQHVVQDGGSTDSTTSVLAAADSPVEWASERDDGQSDALNRAIAKARGEWIAWLNADEFYLPGMLMRLADRGAQAEADVVYGDALLADEAGRLLRLLPAHRFSASVLSQYGCFIESCSLLIRRDVMGQAPWSKDNALLMDWRLLLDLNSLGARFLHVPEPVGVFRLHARRVTARPTSEFSTEYQSLRDDYGVARHPLRRRVGHAVHIWRKARDGAYLRQLHWQSRIGSDLRWFASCGSEGPWR